ncbi:MAG: efflux transporter outer membrane subunit [Chlamydiota bacterium]
MAFFRFVVVVGIALGFFACAVLKKRSDQPQVMSEVTLDDSIEEAIAGSDFELGSWPSYQWWEMFNDDQLSHLMEQAIADNPDLKSAIARVRLAQQQAKEVRSSLFPHLNLDFKDDYQHLSKDSLYRFPPSRVPAVVNQIFLGLSFEYEIDLFGKNREDYRAALGEFKAQQAENSQSLLMITVSFAGAYFAYQTHALQVELIEKKVAKKRNYLDLIEKRVQSGLDDQIAAEDARTDWLIEKEQLAVAKKAVALSTNQIKALLGLSPDDPLVLALPSARFQRPFSLPADLPVELVARRPDLMAQIWRVEAAAHRIGAAKAAFFPNINLASFGRLESLSWSTLFTVDSLAGSLAPALSLPLFTGGKLTAALEKERADFDSAVYNYNALLLKAAREVSDEIKTLQAVNQQDELQREVIVDNKHIVHLTLARFDHGLDDWLTALRTEIELIEQALIAMDLQYQRHIALLRLIRALGGGYHQVEVENG